MKLHVFVLCAAVTAATVSFGNVRIVGGSDYGTITSAVAAATSGDVLLVTTGIYYESVGLYGKDLTISGNYNDTFTEVLTGAYLVVPTIINAPTTNLSVIAISGSVVRLANLNVTGAAITNTSGVGGGVRVSYGSSVIMEHCNVYSNIVKGSGGGAAVSYASTLTLRGTSIRENRANSYIIAFLMGGQGAGVSVSESTLLLEDEAEIINNTAMRHGGGVYLYGNSECVATDSSISYNSANRGGGAAVIANSRLAILESGELAGNTASDKGGGVMLTSSSLQLDTGIVAGNIAATNGGGIYSFGSEIVVSNFGDIAFNTAYQDGAGIYMEASTGVFCDALFHPLISVDWTNCAHRNGGGIYAEYSVLSMQNTIMCQCHADMRGGAICSIYSDIMCSLSELGDDISGVPFSNSAGDVGGGIYILGGNVEINGCVMRHNLAATNGACAYMDETSARFLSCTIVSNLGDASYTVYSPNAFSMSNCILWGNEGTPVNSGKDLNYCDIEDGYATGTGNINTDPLFADSALRL